MYSNDDLMCELLDLKQQVDEIRVVLDKLCAPSMPKANTRGEGTIKKQTKTKDKGPKEETTKVHIQIVDIFEREMKKVNSRRNIQNRKKWTADAKKLSLLGYDIDYLERLIIFALNDVRNGQPGTFEGWARWIGNIDVFRQKISKIEVAYQQEQDKKHEKGSSVVPDRLKYL